MTMKKIYICSPYRGDVERNVALAKAHARFAARCGYCPVVPHLMYPQFLKDSDPDERILGITLGVELMKICDEVWILEAQSVMVWRLNWSMPASWEFRYASTLMMAAGFIRKP